MRVAEVVQLDLQLDAAGKAVAVEPLSYMLEFKPAEYQAALDHGYELKAPLVIHASTRVLRVVLRDPASGLVGSVSVPLEKFLPAVEEVSRQQP